MSLSTTLYAAFIALWVGGWGWVGVKLAQLLIAKLNSK